MEDNYWVVLSVVMAGLMALTMSAVIFLLVLLRRSVCSCQDHVARMLAANESIDKRLEDVTVSLRDLAGTQCKTISDNLSKCVDKVVAVVECESKEVGSRIHDSILESTARQDALVRDRIETESAGMNEVVHRFGDLILACKAVGAETSGILETYRKWAENELPSLDKLRDELRQDFRLDYEALKTALCELDEKND